MLATCRKLFEIILRGSYMRIIPQYVSGHVRDTCMKFLGINKCTFYMLVTCRKCFRINNVSCSSTMVSLPQPLRVCSLALSTTFFEAQTRTCCHARFDWLTRVPDNGNKWRKFRVIPRLHTLRPVFLYFVYLVVVETEGLLQDYQGRAGIMSIVRWNLRPVVFGVELFTKLDDCQITHLIWRSA